MFITVKKWTVYYMLSLILLVVSFALIMDQGSPAQTTAAVLYESEELSLIIDPGHGGEDGGAVAYDGTVESHINLAVACNAADLARFLGWNVYMTRTEDVSIYDESAQTLREKKVSDMKNRVEFCNSIHNAVLISIHQNSLPSAKNVRGAQVFYNEHEQSNELAAKMQTDLNHSININNPKEAKSIGNNSYLMKNVNIPALLIECGFLSNETETQMLKTSDYQRKLAVCIIASIASSVQGNEK